MSSLASRCALIAALIIPAAGSAATVTITGKVASYDTFTAGGYYDDNGDWQTYSSSQTVTKGGYVGDKYTITLDVVGGAVQNQSIDSPISALHVFDLGQLSGTGYTASSTDDGSGTFDVRSIDVAFDGSGTFSRDSGNGDNGSEDYLALHLVSMQSAIPEPATWAMMLLGFAGIGGMMRRRLRARAASARLSPALW